MTEAYKEFLAKVSEDEALKARVEAIDMTDPEAAVREAIDIAAELGIEMTREDFIVKPEQTEELTDDELAAVAGGGGACACSGGGYGGSYGKTAGSCVCVIGGMGTFKDDVPTWDPFEGKAFKSDSGCGCFGPGGGGKS